MVSVTKVVDALEKINVDLSKVATNINENKATIEKVADVLDIKSTDVQAAIAKTEAVVSKTEAAIAKTEAAIAKTEAVIAKTEAVVSKAEPVAKAAVVVAVAKAKVAVAEVTDVATKESGFLSKIFPCLKPKAE